MVHGCYTSGIPHAALYYHHHYYYYYYYDDDDDDYYYHYYLPSRNDNHHLRMGLNGVDVHEQAIAVRVLADPIARRRREFLM